MSPKALTRQRGVTFIGAVLWIGVIVGIYFGASFLPLIKDDYALKQLARGACNDFLSRHVTDAAGVEDSFSRAMANEPELAKVKVQASAVVDEEAWKYARLTVSYKRSWKLLFTKKAYVRSFKWTMSAER